MVIIAIVFSVINFIILYILYRMFQTLNKIQQNVISHVAALTDEHNKLVNLIHTEIEAQKDADLLYKAMSQNYNIGNA